MHHINLVHAALLNITSGDSNEWKGQEDERSSSDMEGAH